MNYEQNYMKTLEKSAMMISFIWISCHIFLFSFSSLCYKDREVEKELVIVDKVYALSFVLLQLTVD